MKLLYFLPIYICICLFDLTVVGLDLPLRHLSKPLIVLSLLLTTIVIIKSKKVEFLIFLLALVFALMGDVFLLFEGDQNFQFGLASFLVMQFLYAYCFYRQKGIGAVKELPKLIGLAMVAIVLNLILWDYTATLRLPVILYTLSIVFMSMTAILRWKVNGYYLVLGGVLLFIFSDSYLAINKFRMSLWKADFVVILSYMLAQGLIVFGYLKALKTQDQ